MFRINREFSNSFLDGNIKISSVSLSFIRMASEVTNCGVQPTEPKAMQLGEVIRGISSLNDELCILAEKPWTSESKAELVHVERDSPLPIELTRKGLSYFLEIHVANEVFEVFGQYVPTNEEKVRLLIYYAENDAYPNWVYEK